MQIVHSRLSGWVRIALWDGKGRKHVHEEYGQNSADNTNNARSVRHVSTEAVSSETRFHPARRGESMSHHLGVSYCSPVFQE